MSRIATKRLTKELTDLRTGGCPAGCALLKADDLQEWILTITAPDSLYTSETFALRFRFSNQYPIDAPEVTFVVTPPNQRGSVGDHWTSPVHPHIYSNGHICASILSTGWSPVLNCQAICLTLQSMLASCKKKERPPDNERYVKTAPLSPKDTRWAFHDDTV